MEEKLKLLGTYLESEEIISFYPKFLCILQTLHSTSDYVEQNCHVLVTTVYNFNLACQHIYLKENLKYWKQTGNMKKLQALPHILCI